MSDDRYPRRRGDFIARALSGDGSWLVYLGEGYNPAMLIGRIRPVLEGGGFEARQFRRVEGPSDMPPWDLPVLLRGTADSVDDALAMFGAPVDPSEQPPVAVDGELACPLDLAPISVGVAANTGGLQLSCPRCGWGLLIPAPPSPDLE